MCERGGTDADCTKKAMDSVSYQNENIPRKGQKHKGKLSLATADGANVNMGIYNGVLTQLHRERPLLINVHCANHGLELAIKAIVSEVGSYTDCDRFYIHDQDNRILDISCSHLIPTLERMKDQPLYLCCCRLTLSYPNQQLCNLHKTPLHPTTNKKKPLVFVTTNEPNQYDFSMTSLTFVGYTTFVPRYFSGYDLDREFS